MNKVVKYILGVVVIVVSFGIIVTICDKLDQYTMKGRCTGWTDEFCEFTLDNGHYYLWEFDTPEEADKVSFQGNYMITMKDYEDGNPYNDAIVSFKEID